MGRDEKQSRNIACGNSGIIQDLCGMIHDKTGLLHLAEIMAMRGIKYLIVSPGSRNAPIVSVFCKHHDFKCLTIVDERSAAFFALGMAQQLGHTVAIACTSGSAALNYAPAVAEAFYQKIPLLVLTADRPIAWIDQGDGQTIRQQDVFANYIKKSLQLPQSVQNQDDLLYNDRLVSEALNACEYPLPGPVHINIPFTEPLYGFDQQVYTKPKDFTVLPAQSLISDKEISQIANDWKRFKKKMILVGQMAPNQRLEKQLAALSRFSDVVVLTETTSNVNHPGFIAWIDRSLGAVPKDDPAYAPDLLITIGGTIVSKQIKSYLRCAPVQAHWHIDPVEWQMDTYQKLTLTIPLKEESFFDQLMPKIQAIESSFSHAWKQLALKAEKNHQRFLQNCPYCDLKIFETIVQSVPSGYDIQLGNSTPVRYAQLFSFREAFRFDSNRGTSGIDGSISTAAGAAYATGQPTLMITGDLGFFYDSNALWNKHLPANLRIVVINNGGGGIFRFIPGPDTSGLMEEFFEAQHHTSAEHMAKSFGLDYYAANNIDELKDALVSFFKPAENAAILEVVSPASTSADTLRAYFKALAV
jgi:2-succinyl-5-enolpyruvyl-6-hydroxy-3-cyclohexene-1-carboxylate synthase